jgi:hypothetical protein
VRKQYPLGCPGIKQFCGRRIIQASNLRNTELKKGLSSGSEDQVSHAVPDMCIIDLKQMQ